MPKDLDTKLQGAGMLFTIDYDMKELTMLVIDEIAPLPVTMLNVPESTESKTEVVSIGVSDFMMVSKSSIKVRVYAYIKRMFLTRISLLVGCGCCYDRTRCNGVDTRETRTGESC